MQGRSNDLSWKFFWPPTFGLRGENKTKQDITVFITAIMTYKRLRLPAPNDYYRGLCYCYGYGAGETETERMSILSFDHSILWKS